MLLTRKRCLWKNFLMTWITSELHSWYGKFFLLFSEKCPCNTFLPLLSVIVLFNPVLIFCHVPCLFWCCMLASNFSNFRSVEKYVVCSLWGPFFLTWNCNQKFWLKKWQILMVFAKAPSWLITEHVYNKFLAMNLLLYA